MLCRVPHTPPIRRSDDEGQRVKMDNSFLCVCVCAVLLRHVCIPYGGLVYFVYRTRSAAQWTEWSLSGRLGQSSLVPLAE